LLEDWPVDDDLVVPVEALPDNLKDSMGSQWRLQEKNQKILREQEAQ
jgi:ribonuclease Z